MMKKLIALAALAGVLICAAPSSADDCVTSATKIAQWKERGFAYEVFSDTIKIGRAREFLQLHDIAVPGDAAAVMVVWFDPFVEVAIVRDAQVCAALVFLKPFGDLMSDYVATAPPPDPPPIFDL